MKRSDQLTKIEVIFNPETDIYPYLHLQYEITTDAEKKLIDIPKAKLPLNVGQCFIDVDCSGYPYTSAVRPVRFINLLDSKIELMPSSDDSVYSEKVLEKYTRKMTVKEIEKALGYPVEIISEKS